MSPAVSAILPQTWHRRRPTFLALTAAVLSTSSLLAPAAADRGEKLSKGKHQIAGSSARKDGDGVHDKTVNGRGSGAAATVGKGRDARKHGGGASAAAAKGKGGKIWPFSLAAASSTAAAEGKGASGPEAGSAVSSELSVGPASDSAAAPSQGEAAEGAQTSSSDASPANMAASSGKSSGKSSVKSSLAHRGGGGAKGGDDDGEAPEAPGDVPDKLGELLKTINDKYGGDGSITLTMQPPGHEDEGEAIQYKPKDPQEVPTAKKEELEAHLGKVKEQIEATDTAATETQTKAKEYIKSVRQLLVDAHKVTRQALETHKDFDDTHADLINYEMHVINGTINNAMEEMKKQPAWSKVPGNEGDKDKDKDDGEAKPAEDKPAEDKDGED